MKIERVLEVFTALIVAALLVVTAPLTGPSRAQAGAGLVPGSFKVADNHTAEDRAARKRRKAEERKRRQQQRQQQRSQQQQQRQRQRTQQPQQRQRQRTQQQQQRQRQRTQQQQQRQRQRTKQQQQRQRQRTQQQQQRQRQRTQQQQQQRQKQRTQQQQQRQKQRTQQQQQRQKQRTQQQQQQRQKQRTQQQQQRQKQRTQQQQQRQKQRTQQQQQRRQRAQDKPKDQRRLDRLRRQAQEREDRKSQRQRVKNRQQIQRQERRIKEAQERRERLRRRNEARNARQVERLNRRRSELRRNLNTDARREARRDRRLRRMDRQRDWERRQTRRDRRRWRRDFGFHRRARIVRRRDDHIIYAGLAIAAVGALAGAAFIYHNDDVRFGWRADDVYVEPLPNGWTRTVVVRPDGVRIVTIRDSRGFIVRRYRVFPDNEVVFLYNNQPSWWDDEEIYVDVEPVNVGIPEEQYIVEPSYAPVETIYETVTAPPVEDLDRTYTLNQVLVNARLRDYMPRIDLDTITFASGSADIPVDQIDKLETIGVAMEKAIKENSSEVYLLEGHTDATGSETTNLELSDRRASAVANILTEYFEIPPENLVTQGYGEQFLKIQTQGAEQRNRRVAIRRITPLLSTDKQQIAFDDKGNEVIPEEAVQ